MADLNISPCSTCQSKQLRKLFVIILVILIDIRLSSPYARLCYYLIGNYPS